MYVFPCMLSLAVGLLPISKSNAASEDKSFGRYGASGQSIAKGILGSLAHRVYPPRTYHSRMLEPTMRDEYTSDGGMVNRHLEASPGISPTCTFTHLAEQGRRSYGISGPTKRQT